MACGKGSTSKGNARYSGIIREGCLVSGGGGARCEDEDADDIRLGKLECDNAKLKVFVYQSHFAQF